MTSKINNWINNLPVQGIHRSGVKHSQGKVIKNWVNNLPVQGIHRSGVKHSQGKVIPHSNLGRQETHCKLWRSSPWYIKHKWMIRGRSSGKTLGMSTAGRNRWKLTEQMVIRVLINLVQPT